MGTTATDHARSGLLYLGVALALVAVAVPVVAFAALVAGAVLLILREIGPGLGVVVLAVVCPFLPGVPGAHMVLTISVCVLIVGVWVALLTT